jgi:hypothetical protein
MKFYEFSQNNTGGSFDVDEHVCHRLFIEADDVTMATDIAINLGVYFNGVARDMDCPCCGDRWYEQWVDGISFPYKYSDTQIFDDVESYAQYLADDWGWTSPDARIFYKNGLMKEIFSKKV